jgi:hypothetical protein
MRRNGKGSGGGIGMNKNVSPQVRLGSGSHSTNPGYVSQLGNKVGSHTRQGDTVYDLIESANELEAQAIELGRRKCDDTTK